MRQNYKHPSNYEFRVVKAKDILVDHASGGSCSVYQLCELRKGINGKQEITVLTDMTSYTRPEATDFLMQVSAAALKPVLDEDGNEIESSLINPGEAVQAYLQRRTR